MDELEISGKRYISSRRAAKENKYHGDYIGQLIRAGKITGTKVGRAWYVEAGSLAAYLDSEDLRSAPIAAPVGIKKLVDIEEEKEPEPREWEPEVKQVKPISAPPTLRYISEDQPLFAARFSPELVADTKPLRLAYVLLVLGFVGLGSAAAAFGVSSFFQYKVFVNGSSSQASIDFAPQKLGN